MRRRDFLAAAAGGALALAGPARAGGGGPRPLVLVTADLEAHVAAVDVRSGRVVHRVRTPPGPRSIEGALSRPVAVAACTETGVVVVLDTGKPAVRRVLEDFDEPRYTAISPDGRLAYVTDSGSGQLITIDLASARVIHRLEVGAGARHCSIHPSGATVWISLGTKAAALAVVACDDPRRPALRRRVPPLDLAHDVGLAPDGRRLWVTSGALRRIAIHDARSFRVVARVPAGSPPQHVTFMGDRVHVASGDDGTLRVHDPAGRALHTARVPAGSFNVAQGADWTFTPSLSQGTLCVLDQGGRVLRRIQVARAAHDACYAIAG